jgi:hypothetical protein
MGMYTYRFGSRGSVVLAGARITFGPTFFYCRRIFKEKYKISGITQPGYVNYDPILKQWVPFAIDDLIMRNYSTCGTNGSVFISAENMQNPRTWLVNVKMDYLKNGAGPGAYGIQPPGTWVIYNNNGSSFSVMATAKSLYPPRKGWTTHGTYSGNVSVI